MKLLLFISVATFSVVLKFDHVLSQNTGENELLAVLVGEYEVVKETIDKGYHGEKFLYTNFPKAGLGDATVVQTSSFKEYYYDNVFQIVLTKGQYTLKQWSLKSDLGNKNWTDVTNENLDYYPECDIILSRIGKGSFNGTTDNCKRYIPPESKPENLKVTLNCTHFIRQGKSGIISLRKKYSYRLPRHLTVDPPPCPKVPIHQKPSK